MRDCRRVTQCLFLHVVLATCTRTRTCLVATLLTSLVRTLGLVYLRALRRRRRPATHNGGKPFKKTVELLPQKQLCRTIGLLAR